MKRKQQILTLVLFIVIASGVGSFIGYGMASHKETQDIAALQNKINKLSKTSSLKSVQPKQDNTSASFAVIKEYGVKFPYVSTPPDLGYVMLNNIVNFDTESLAALGNQKDSANTCSTKPGNLGTFLQSSTDQGLPAVKDSKTDGVVARLGNYYYIYKHPEQYCSTNQDVKQEQDKQAAELLEDLFGLKASS